MTLTKGGDIFMHTKNLRRVAEELEKTHKIRNLKISREMIDYHCDKCWYSWAETSTEIEFNDRLYKILLKMLPKEIRLTLKKLDKEIFKLRVEIKKSTGWELFDRTSMYHGYKPERPFFKEPEVKRNENGFYVEMQESYLYQEHKAIDESAKQFYEENKETLKKLHDLMSMKELILNKTISLVSEENKDLTREILLFLGYNPNEENETTYNNRFFI